MSAKRVFFGVLQKIMVFCCAIFFGFSNAFSANLPSGYTQLEYLESTVAPSDAYIDTGRNFNSSYMYEITYSKGGASNGIMGARVSTTSTAKGNFSLTYGSSQSAVYSSTSSGSSSSKFGDTTYGVIHTVKYQQSTSTLLFDNTNKWLSAWITSVSIPYNVYLFGFNNAGNPGGARTEYVRIYSYSVKDANGNLIQNFVPVKYVSNGTTTYGMYDLADPNPATAFHTNQGTGEFTGGPMACPGGTLQTYTTVAASDVPAPVQNGTPTPTNPITPTFYTQGNMILRKVGDYADSYDASTGKITRRVGVKVLDGTETGWVRGTNSIYIDGSFNDAIGYSANNPAIICSHFRGGLPTITTSNMPDLSAKLGASSQPRRMYFVYDAMTTAAQFQQFLAEQYANGTPVVVYYPLGTPVEEDWAPEQCSNAIKIATTAYNSARFSPVVNDLNTTIATIRDIVTNTINQTAAIASLQADKQTRPEDACPAGKKCLLVETEENGVIVPHWYEIIENIYGLPAGYTPLEYIQSDGASYLIVPYRVNNKTVFYCRYNEIQNGPQVATAVFGVTDTPDVTKANYGILRLLNGSSSFNRMGWGDSTSGSIINVYAPQNLDTWYEVLYDQNKLYQNNTLYATSATQPSTSWTANYDLGIFARNGSSVTMPAVAKISSVWAKENGEYKINLVPAKRNSDNVIGMYDTVNDVFYTNSGTGTFTAGPEI